MNTILKILKYIGLYGHKDHEKPNTSIDKYNEVGYDLARRHLQYLKELSDSCDKRQGMIESKNSQMIGQSGLIISIFALFIPLFIDKLSDLPILIKIVLVTIYVWIQLHYLLSIHHAISTLEIHKYRYIRRSSSTVTGKNRSENVDDFINEEIRDLIMAVVKNTETNNRKADNLIFATRNFKIASYGFLVFTSAIILSCINYTKRPEDIYISRVSKDASKYLTPVITINSESNEKYKAIESELGLAKTNIDSLKAQLKLLTKSDPHPENWNDLK